MLKRNKNDLLILLVSIILLVISIYTLHLRTTLIVISYLLLSYNIIAKIIKNFIKGKIALDLIIIIIVTLGLLYLNKYYDTITILVLYKMITILKQIILDKSQSEINYLSNLNFYTANLKLDDKIITVNIERIRINDIIVINKEEIIPLDGKVIKGISKVNLSISSTIKNIKDVMVGDNLLSGMKNLDDTLELQVTATYDNTYLSRIHRLLPKKNELKNKIEKTTKHIYRYYLIITILVLIIIGIISGLGILHLTDEWLYRLFGILLLTSFESLLLSINFNYNNSQNEALKANIYIKKKNILDALIKRPKIIFSFNEVLTKNIYKINQIIPYNISKQQLLMYVASASYYGQDAIALTLKECDNNININNIKNYVKTASDSFQAMVNDKLVLVGNKKIFFKQKIKFPNIDIVGTSVLIAVDNEYIGTIILENEIKEETFLLNHKLNEYNLEMLAFLSSDNKRLMNKLNDKLDFSIQYSDKIENEILELKKDNIIAYVGNSSECLELADIGITINPHIELIDSSDIIIENNDVEAIIKVLNIAYQNNKNVMSDLFIVGSIKLLSVIFIILNLPLALILLSEVLAMLIIVIKRIIINNKQKEH